VILLHEGEEMKRFNAVFVLLILSFLPVLSTAHDLVWPGEKLKAMYPQAESFEQKNLYMSDEQRSRIESALGTKLTEEDLKPSIYLAVVRTSSDSPPRKAAAMIFIDAYGEGGKIEMGVVVGGKGEVMKVLIFENRESGEITSDAFLKQLEGKKASDSFTVKAPAGKEKPAQAIASGAKRGLLIINEMFRKK
jgi:hypothetical protein